MKPVAVLQTKSMTRLILISGSVIALDQLTKAVISHHLVLHESIPVVKGFFNITHVLNPGGAFGIFAGHSPELRKFFFLFISSIVACLLLWFYRQTSKEYRVLSAGIACIFGGAVGNLIDRFRFGKVVDFLDVYVSAYHWPAFNIADSAICIGMGVFIYHIVFKKIPDF